MGIEVRGPTVAQMGMNIGAQVKRYTVKTFESVLREEVGKGFDNEPVIFTDGWVRRDYHQVRNFGRIEARPRATLGNVVPWLLEELRRLSPVLSGRYQHSHVAMVDGRVVPDGELSTMSLAGKRVMVVNPQPYAGKIEGKDAFTRYETRGGKKSRRSARRRAGMKASAMRGQSKMAPNGVYRVAILNLQKRFGRTVVALYQPQALPGGVTVKTKGGKSRAQIYPAIVLAILR